ncbi:MAG: hypothetical protein PSV16_03655 [Flavobacterium sp.]|nr:hypothetical protein [Flavobacterium sp.]
MKQIFLKFKFDIALIVIALLWLYVFDFLFQISTQSIGCPDCNSYLSAAKNLYQLHIGNQYRPMGIAAINGFPLLFGFSDDAVFAFGYYVNIGCWIGTTLVIFELSKTYLKPKIAFLVALVLIFFIGNTTLVFQLMSETVFMFAIAVVFYFLFKYFKNNNFSSLAIALSIMIFAMLIKPGALFLAIIVSLFFVKVLIRNYGSRWMALVYGAVLLVMVQCAGIKYQFGNFTISYIDGLTYYNYLGSKAKCMKEDEIFNQQNNPYGMPHFSALPSEQKKIAVEDLKFQLQTNTVNLARAYADDVYGNTTSGSSYVLECENKWNTTYFETSKFVFYSASQWQNIFFTIIGFLLSIWYFFKGNQQFRLIAIFVIYTIVSSGISCDQGDRFHVITFPFVLLLIAKFLVENFFKRHAARLQT